jgi:F-type H+-transporting ATPase subunit delta
MEPTRHTTVLDTGLQYLGTVYAKALLGATEKSGTTELVLSELQSVLDDVLARLPQFEAALSSPRIPMETKERMLDRAFGGKMSVQLINFLKVLSRRGRFNSLRNVYMAARRIVNELRGRVEVRLTTAEPLDTATRDLVVNKLRAALGRDVELLAHVDPDLIGGLVIRVGDTVYDGSVANQLRRLRQELVARASQTLGSQTDRFTLAQ